MLWLMVAIGFVSACLAGASRGSSLGMGLAVAMIATLIPLLVGAVIYWFAVGLAHFVALLSNSRPSGVEPVVEATLVEPVPEGPADA